VQPLFKLGAQEIPKKVMPDHRILLLGSSGFIGQKLVEKLRADNISLLVYNRLDVDIDDKVLEYCPTAVINCAASKGNASFEDSFEANVAFPLRVLKTLSHLKHRTSWIQLSSYFELQINYGRADAYAFHKATIGQILQENFKEICDVKLLFLPHIVNIDAKPNSLFSNLGKAYNGERITLTTSGEQFIPILHLDDTVTAICAVLLAPPKTYFAKPVWYGSLAELLNEFLKLQKTYVYLNKNQRSVDYNFPKVIFEPIPPGWKAKKDLVAIFEDFEKRGKQ
jgi:nucleoside-diphosphate-sugar epimerase